MIIIKKLPVERWQDYKSLRLRSVREEPESFICSYEEELALPDSEWQVRLENSFKPNENRMLFAHLEEKMIGMGGLLVGPHEKTKHIATIVSVYVVPEMRNQGVGQELLESLLQEAQLNANIIKVQLTVDTSAKAAITLYKKLGFVTVCTLNKAVKHGDVYHDEFLMGLDII